MIRIVEWLSANADEARLSFGCPDGSLLGTRIVKRLETNHDGDYFRACFAPGRHFVDVGEPDRKKPRLSATDLVSVFFPAMLT
jgi:hypothetical protein